VLEGGNLEQAELYLNYALELDPDLGLAHYNLGLVRYQRSDLDRAIDSFRAAQRHSPAAPEPSYYLGTIYLQQGETRRAEAAFDRALDRNPNYIEARYQLGIVHLSNGDLDDALAEFRQIRELAPDYANAYYGAGLVFLSQGQPEEAREVLAYAERLYRDRGQTEWAQRARALLDEL